VDPNLAITDKRWTIIFPTRMNLVKLGQAKSVAEAIARAKAAPVVTVEPTVEVQDGQQVLVIPEDAGYGRVAEPMTSIRG
jgi:predicted RNase H-like HicB family nuclease